MLSAGHIQFKMRKVYFYNPHLYLFRWMFWSHPGNTWYISSFVILMHPLSCFVSGLIISLWLIWLISITMMSSVQWYLHYNLPSCIQPCAVFQRLRRVCNNCYIIINTITVVRQIWSFEWWCNKASELQSSSPPRCSVWHFRRAVWTGNTYFLAWQVQTSQVSDNRVTSISTKDKLFLSRQLFVALTSWYDRTTCSSTHIIWEGSRLQSFVLYLWVRLCLPSSDKFNTEKRGRHSN